MFQVTLLVKIFIEIEDMAVHPRLCRICIQKHINVIGVRKQQLTLR